MIRVVYSHNKKLCVYCPVGTFNGRCLSLFVQLKDCPLRTIVQDNKDMVCNMTGWKCCPRLFLLRFLLRLRRSHCGQGDRLLVIDLWKLHSYEADLNTL